MVSVLGVESAGTDVKDNELMDGVVGGGGGVWKYSRVV
jgi:hypothetical protein